MAGPVVDADGEPTDSDPVEGFVALDLTARQWATIDSQMDNSAQAARDSLSVEPDDDDDEMPAPDALAMAIRQAGWDQVPWAGPSQGWPPDEQVIGIRLHPGQWAYAVEELKRSEATYERLGDDESLRLTRDAVAAITGQLSNG